MLDGSPYQGYLYAYPHKTAYRPLRPRPALREVWAGEPREALFLYLHVPFCEMRCGFCNLFTRANPPAEQVGAYLRQLRHQAAATADSLGGAGFARAAIGGGTPTYLTADELAELLAIPAGLGVDLPRAALSVETSPATATADRIAVLAGHGVHRVSMGVQSFLDAEAHAAGRPQRRAEVEAALDVLFAAPLPVRNLDLIYGIPGQTAATWQFSLDETLRRRPEEVYLYPLYVRPLTGLARRHDTAPDPAWDGQRLDLYRQGRDALRAAGYRQLSMRQFRRSDVPDPDGPDYCCQDDGMVGLGCGSRSYTRELHYSFDYAVGVGGVRAIIDDYLRRPPGDFAYAEHGFRLDAVEQRRRWLLKSLLRVDGLDLAAYTKRFGTDADRDFPALPELAARGWLDADAGVLRLTDDGLAHSDAIGPWLVSGPVRELMAGHAPR
ncbi:STM4012 family radical SAM protein [Catellatospora sp. KI3]|uniref:STM4012 family radical SAM protein n=1 Tax=Catellatospora sp. KI3 TaxID=3041620 RepID=UPI002482349B|nr:STM4012 family radical SAM protein [Catellatospora sp. KI3]MDI1463858.1 STM4012 family radical SAM protein [Catellatospora sp. KI3]